MSTFSQRMVGAAKLEVSIYKEVRADTQATGQALGVVVLSSIAQGIAAFAQGGLRGFALGTGTALVVWFVWALVVYLVGTKILPEPLTRSDLGGVLRTTGFAASPGLLAGAGFGSRTGFFDRGRRERLGVSGHDHRGSASTGLREYGAYRGGVSAWLVPAYRDRRDAEVACRSSEQGSRTCDGSHRMRRG